MKKWFALGAIFLGLYFSFLVASIPATWLLSFIKLPNTVQVVGISGTAWQAHINKVQVNDLEINDITSEVNIWSLFIFDPSIDLKFGSALASGPEGQVTISQLTNNLKVTDLQVNLLANQVVEQLALPVPVKAHDYLTLNIDEFIVGKPVCEKMSGNLQWKKAAVTALSERIDVGELSATLSCDDGALAVKVNPDNNLGLSFTAYIHGTKRFSGDGFLKPSDKFPKSIKQVLPFLGKADAQGRYRLAL
jgi:general secretion pathway protein N